MLDTSYFFCQLFFTQSFVNHVFIHVEHLGSQSSAAVCLDVTNLDTSTYPALQ